MAMCRSNLRLSGFMMYVPPGCMTYTALLRPFTQQFVVTYNSTRAIAQPVFLDVYIQETLQNGFVYPYYVLKRTSYPSDAKSLTFTSTVRTQT